MGFLGGANGKEPAWQCRALKRRGFKLWVGKIPGGGHGYPLQCSCLGNPMDRGAWWAIVHGVTKSWTRLRKLHFSFTEKSNPNTLWQPPSLPPQQASFRPQGLCACSVVSDSHPLDCSLPDSFVHGIFQAGILE